MSLWGLCIWLTPVPALTTFQIVSLVAVAVIVLLAVWRIRTAHAIDRLQLLAGSKVGRRSGLRFKPFRILLHLVLLPIYLLGQLRSVPEVYDRIRGQANLTLSFTRFLGLSLVIAGVVGGLGWLVSHNVWLASADAGMALAIPWIWLTHRRKTWSDRFSEQLPDALELISRAMRAGHSVASGLHVVSEELPSPISDEFARLYEEQNLGITLEESLQSACERTGSIEFRFFTTTILIQRQTGGDLAEILGKITTLIRQRQELAKARALNRTYRQWAWFTVCSPFVLVYVLLHPLPDYVARLWTDPTGRQMSIAALIAHGIGSVLILRLMRIRV